MQDSNEVGRVAEVGDEYRCNRCEHEWSGRVARVPICCPGCKSPLWNRERQRARPMPKQVGVASEGGIHAPETQGKEGV